MNNIQNIPVSGPLTLAEQKFVNCMKLGIPCEIGGNRPSPALDAAARNNLVIRADLIRFFLLGGNEHHKSGLSGFFSLQGAWVDNPLVLIGNHIPCGLNFQNCHFADMVQMQSMQCHRLDLMGSYLAAGFMGYNMSVGNDIHMRGNLTVKGPTFLARARIGGNLHCSGIFENAGGSAIDVSKAEIGGNCSLMDNFSAEGGIDLYGTHIGGDFLCNGSIRKLAISATHAKVDGEISFTSPFLAEKAVNFSFASIGGRFFCSGTLKNGLIALGAKIGDVFFHDTFSTEGPIALIDAEIGKNLSCYGTFHGANVLAARGAEIGNTLILRNINGGGTVDLSFASADIIDDGEESLKKFRFNLDGFSYRRFVRPLNAQSRIDWLDSQPRSIGFAPQPFEQAAKALFAMGYNNDARKILLAKERRLTKLGKLSRLHKMARWLWDSLAGYGYDLWKTLKWSAVCVVFGSMIFGYTDHLCRIVPSQPAMVVDGDYRNANTRKCTMPSQPTKAVAEMYPAYPRFNYVFYSLDVFIPFFALSQEPYWHPQPEEGDTEIVVIFSRYWYWFEVIAGWVLTSLLVLSATGLLRPRQSSGGE